MFFPFVTIAGEIRIDMNKANIGTKEQFLVNVIVFTNEPINAVEGQISFNPNMLEVKEIRDGGSSVNIWIEKPEITSNGTIVFSGITPGGFLGVNNQLFTIVFEAKDSGIASIVINNAKALQNDGIGTKIPLAFRNVKINIQKENNAMQEEISKDTTIPEPFKPIITQDLSLFENNWFVVFATQDKISGISHYEIKEYKFRYFSFLSRWKTADSPYVLTDQSLKSRIIIKAIDNAHNTQTAKINPTNPLLWYEYTLYWFIIISISCGIFCLAQKTWKRKKNI